MKSELASKCEKMVESVNMSFSERFPPDAKIEESFNTFLAERFPPDTKRSTSGVIRASFGERIVRIIQDPSTGDKNLRFWVKRHGFQLLDVPSLGVQKVLVVPLKEKAEV